MTTATTVAQETTEEMTAETVATEEREETTDQATTDHNTVVDKTKDLPAKTPSSHLTKAKTLKM